jgi:hypothetical protein
MMYDGELMEYVVRTYMAAAHSVTAESTSDTSPCQPLHADGTADPAFALALLSAGQFRPGPPSVPTQPPQRTLLFAARSGWPCPVTSTAEPTPTMERRAA